MMNHYEIDKHRRNEMIRAAEQHNLASEISAPADTARLYKSTMVKIGKTLTRIGEDLRERYSEAEVMRETGTYPAV